MTVSNLVVDPSFTSLTFDLTTSEDAAAEFRPVIVVTENGTHKRVRVCTSCISAGKIRKAG